METNLLYTVLLTYAALCYGAFITVAFVVPTKFKAGDWLMVVFAPLSLIVLAIYAILSFKKQ
jgi:hypothetical protein